MGNDPRAMVRFGRGIMVRASLLGSLGGIKARTLIVVGEHDVVTPLPCARRMAEGMHGAKLAIIPHAGHLCTVEEPAAVNDALTSFLGGAKAS